MLKATTDTGIVIYRLDQYSFINENAKELLYYFNQMLLAERLENLEIEFYANADMFCIYHVEDSSKSFSICCLDSYNTYRVSPNQSCRMFTFSFDSLKDYIENLFYVETEADLY